MLKIIVRFGLFAGLIVAIPMMGIMLFAHSMQDLGGMLPTYLVMLVALSMVFVGIKQHRDRNLGGVIGFMPAFLLGLGISAVAGVFYVAGWELSQAFAKFDFAQEYSELFVKAAKARGANAAELAKAQADAAEFLRSYSNPFFRLPMTFLEIFPVGILVSLISALVLRNPRVLPARAAA